MVTGCILKQLAWVQILGLPIFFYVSVDSVVSERLRMIIERIKRIWQDLDGLRALKICTP